MIDYASRQRTPRKHLIGLTVVVVLHGLLFWAINSGLARKFVKVIKGPVEAVLLEETKPDIPPPPPPPPPPKNLPPPPPSYVPPVDIQVATPPPVNAIAAVSNTPQPVAPPSPLPVQMSAPPAPPATAPVKTGVVANSGSCKVDASDYPSASKRLEEEGTAIIRFLVTADGRVLETQIEKSSGFKRLDQATEQLVKNTSKCKFTPATIDGKQVQEWGRMQYVWRLEQ
jgi:protein TonB